MCMVDVSTAMSRILMPLTYRNGKVFPAYPTLLFISQFAFVCKCAASWLQDNCLSSKHYIHPQRYREEGNQYQHVNTQVGCVLST